MSNKLHNYVRTYRKRASLTQGELAFLLGARNGRIRTGHGPENITRLRRFAIGVIKSKGAYSVAQKMWELNLKVRLVFDYLRMTKLLRDPLCLKWRRENKFTV